MSERGNSGSPMPSALGEGENGKSMESRGSSAPPLLVTAVFIFQQIMNANCKAINEVVKREITYLGYRLSSARLAKLMDMIIIANLSCITLEIVYVTQT